MRVQPRPVRKLRHWKQQYDRNAKFIWRKTLLFNGETYEAGSIVPEGLIKPTKLRRFWEAGVIELAEFEAPDVATGQVKGPLVKHTGGGWYTVTIPGYEPERVKGKDNAERMVAEAKARADAGDK